MSDHVNILVVDDDPDDAFLIEDALREIEAGQFDVDIAPTLDDGLEKLAGKSYDVILCDFRLGAITGIDFLEQIRAQGCEVPFILLTGMGNKSVDEAALKAGAADFLAKDEISPVALDRTIRYAIANHSRQQLLNAALNNADATILITDKDGQAVLWNASFAKLAEREMRPSDGNKIDRLHERIRDHDDGSIMLGPSIYDVHTADLPDGGSLIALHDVTVHVRALEERREAERRISHLAMHDGLTGLPNRSAFNIRLAEELELARVGNGEFYLLTMDLDRFKEINDVFGHQIGDEFLIAVARRLSGALRGDEFLARLGGDEFVAIQRREGPDSGTPELAERIQQVFEHPFAIEGKSIKTAASIGAAIFPHHGNSSEALLSNADAAMYRAKTTLGMSTSVFDSDMDESLRKRRRLANDLKQLVATGGIDVFFQPQALVASGALVGFEALARWRHSEFGFVPPSEFVPMAEENGLIIEMGNQVLRKSCEIASMWPERCRIAVNVSPIQIKHSDLVSSVREVLRSTGLNPRRLELEITESVFIDDLEATQGTLEKLNEMGISVAMDDFGTGYSSLRSLISFPFDSIKIDKSFVGKVGNCDQAEEILRSVLGLADKLGFDVVAEGVEHEDHIKFLSSQECQIMQGYLIGQPADRRSTEQLITSHQDGFAAELKTRRSGAANAA